MPESPFKSVLQDDRVSPFKSALAPKDDDQSYIGELVSNIPSSAGAVAGDLWEAVSNPVDTVKGLGDVLTGSVQKATNLRELGGDADKEHFAEAAGQFYKDRYGGLENIKNTFRDDPVGGALDLAALVGGAAAAGARLPGVAGRIASTVAKADPLAAAGRGVVRTVDAVRSRPPSNRKFVADAPSPGELKAQASSLFEEAERSGVKFKSDYYNDFVDSTLFRLVDEGADSILSPKVSRVADLLAKSKGRSPSIQEMSILRVNLATRRAVPMQRSVVWQVWRSTR